MFNGIGFSELLVIGGVVVLLFGGKKIPELAKSLGQGIRVFKEEMGKHDNPEAAKGDPSQAGERDRA